MATIHQQSFITNNCYKAPVKPKRDPSYSFHDKSGRSTMSMGDGDAVMLRNGEETGADESENTNASHNRLLFNQTDSYVGSFTADLAGLDDSEFYKRLTDLKNEHKKTLELCERMYQEKIGYKSDPDHLRQSFDQTDRDELENRKNRSTAFNMSLKEGMDLSQSFDAENTDMRLDISYGKPPIAPRAPDTHSLRRSYEGPRSPRNTRSAWMDRSQGADRFWKAMSNYSSEADASVEETLRKPYDEKHHTPAQSATLASRRSSALSQIEGMWDNFSIDEYAPRRSRYRHRSNSLSRLSRSSSFDRNSGRPLSGSISEWRNRVTVPKPFKMTLRESLKEKTRSRNLEEYERQLREREREEHLECQKKFKAKPVPAHVYMPLYDEMNQKNEEKRQEIREASMELTKSLEKPFKFMQRNEERREKRSRSYGSVPGQNRKKKNFRAKPFPAHLFQSSTEDKMLEEEEYRKIRVQMRAEEMMRESQLPPRMAERKYRHQVSSARNKKAYLMNDFKFKPKINDDVPDFNELHREFHKEMAHRKMEKEATVCKPFTLRTDQIVRSKRQQYEEASRKSAASNNWAEATLSSSQGTDTLSRSMMDSLPTKMTASAQLRSMSSKRKMQEAIDKEIHDLQEERKRRAKERQLRKVVAEKAAANDISPVLEQTKQAKMQEFREAEKARLAEYRKQLNEMKERVEARPLLFERASQESAARAAERRYKQTLKRAGLDDKFIEKKGSAATSAATSRPEAADSDSDESYSHTQKKVQSESNRYSEDFDDDGASGSDKSSGGSDVEEDLPNDNSDSR